MFQNHGGHKTPRVSQISEKRGYPLTSRIIPTFHRSIIIDVSFQDEL